MLYGIENILNKVRTLSGRNGYFYHCTVTLTEDVTYFFKKNIKNYQQLKQSMEYKQTTSLQILLWKIKLQS